ncbi:hypothetical protein [Flavobacterium sp. HSC-61S13]|uniref:hypothetical protein n=1 Tax=Flavobacterium sp. HSC-61S13 TaxID=2910963 RepID=UPI00209D090D|nr:hypothetical protein [Flavobacterium sp. HSC-61S13]MCP1995515.1 hypothetical protein [Flavobacterium sp. HSC-61S13]
MKNVIYIYIIICLYSCAERNSKASKIEVTKVDEIEIINKVDCSYDKLSKGNIVIKDTKQIEEIINTFSYMEPILDRGAVNLKVSYGFFDVIFSEGQKHHFYTINYTVYDGVIIWSNDGGRLYKNDRLEVAVYRQFVK